MEGLRDKWNFWTQQLLVDRVCFMTERFLRCLYAAYSKYQHSKEGTCLTSAWAKQSTWLSRNLGKRPLEKPLETHSATEDMTGQIVFGPPFLASVTFARNIGPNWLSILEASAIEYTRFVTQLLKKFSRCLKGVTPRQKTDCSSSKYEKCEIPCRPAWSDECDSFWKQLQTLFLFSRIKIHVEWSRCGCTGDPDINSKEVNAYYALELKPARRKVV